MIISFTEQTRVLEYLDKARQILRDAKSDENDGPQRRIEIVREISDTFHNVQLLRTQPM